jgi:hypothetical protein
MKREGGRGIDRQTARDGKRERSQLIASLGTSVSGLEDCV